MLSTDVILNLKWGGRSRNRGVGVNLLVKIKGSEFTTESLTGALWEPFCFTVRTESAGYGKHRWFPGGGSGGSFRIRTWTANINAPRTCTYVSFVHRSACHLSSCDARQMCTLGNCRLNSTVGRVCVFIDNGSVNSDHSIL